MTKVAWFWHGKGATGHWKRVATDALVEVVAALVAKGHAVAVGLAMPEAAPAGA